MHHEMDDHDHRRGPGEFARGWGGHPAHHGPRGPHHGGRARRGDVQAAVLGLLAEQDMHGYQIIQELSARSGGAWTPSPGSIYPALQAMEDQELVTSREDAGKRVFSLTEHGRAMAKEHPGQAPWDDMAASSGPRRKLREAMAALGSAVVQVARTGTDEQAARAAAAIDEARKTIYLMLAE